MRTQGSTTYKKATDAPAGNTPASNSHNPGAKRILLLAPVNPWIIQGIRALHAIQETGITIALPHQSRPVYRDLETEFGVRFAYRSHGALEAGDITMCHAQPLIQIGTLSRTLLFPHAIVHGLRQRWPTTRHCRYAFCGLMTAERADAIANWLADHFNVVANISPTRNRSRLLAVLMHYLGISSRPQLSTLGPLSIASSQRGRSSRTKAWDGHYYNQLLNAQFVLCPKGDFVWTYRFFEAILCGALPIVEQACDAFKGFCFATTADDPKSLEWCPEVAESNARLAAHLLTAPHSELFDAVSGCLHRKGVS